MDPIFGQIFAVDPVPVRAGIDPRLGRDRFASEAGSTRVQAGGGSIESMSSDQSALTEAEARPASDSNPLDFVCPRCSRPASEFTYGPCEDCRTELRATLGGAARSIEVPAYEPKMNVVPNQVAVKE